MVEASLYSALYRLYNLVIKEKYQGENNALTGWAEENKRMHEVHSKEREGG